MTQQFQCAPELMSDTKAMLKFWGKKVEDALPRPTITEDVSQLTPSLMLLDILCYARGAESRGEYLFRHNYLHPMFNHFSERESTSWKTDPMGNMYVQVGKVNGVLHVGHVDTVHDDDHSPLQSVTVDAKGIVTLDSIVKQSKPVMLEGQRFVKGTDVKFHYAGYQLPTVLQRCLGADDGCAVAIMLYLIAHEVSGTYVFTRGEEIGCVGTHYIIDNNLIDWGNYQMAIEVDRKGTTEIIGGMSPGSTASRAFVSSLASQLNMEHKFSDLGSITDVGHMAKLVPECVNIAAGYLAQHSDRETTDIYYLDVLGKNMLNVKWEELTIARAAGAYTVVKPYKAPKYAKPLTGTVYARPSYIAKPNSYGDYSTEPVENEIQFAAMGPKFTKENFVRRNVSFISEFLDYLNLSPADMEELMCFGKLDILEDAAQPTNLIKD